MCVCAHMWASVLETRVLARVRVSMGAYRRMHTVATLPPEQDRLETHPSPQEAPKPPGPSSGIGLGVGPCGCLGCGSQGEAARPSPSPACTGWG